MPPDTTHEKRLPDTHSTFSHAIHFLTGGAPPERDAVKKNSHDVNFFFTAPIFDGDGDGKNEMLRKKFYVRREFFYVRRDIFYVASLWGHPYALQKGKVRRAGSGAGRCGRLTL